MLKNARIALHLVAAAAGGALWLAGGTAHAALGAHVSDTGALTFLYAQAPQDNEIRVTISDPATGPPRTETHRGSFNEWGVANTVLVSTSSLPWTPYWVSVQACTSGGCTYAGRVDARVSYPSSPPGFGPWAGMGVPFALTKVAIGQDPASTTWSLGENDPYWPGKTIRHWESSRGAWSENLGAADDLDVAPDGTPWIVASDGTIMRRSWGSWERLPGCGRAIGVGVEGSVWVLGCDFVAGGHPLYRWNESTYSWNEQPFYRAQDLVGFSEWSSPTAARHGGVTLDVDSDGYPWIIDDRGDVYQATAQSDRQCFASTAHPTMVCVGTSLYPRGSGMKRLAINGRTYYNPYRISVVPDGPYPRVYVGHIYGVTTGNLPVTYDTGFGPVYELARASAVGVDGYGNPVFTDGLYGTSSHLAVKAGGY
jgi:hypothetical protein